MSSDALDLAPEYKFCEECQKAYAVSLPHGCVNVFMSSLQVADDFGIQRRRVLQFLCGLILSTVTTAAATSAAFAHRNSTAGLVLADCIISAPWVFGACLPMQWTQPSLNSRNFWMLAILCFGVFVAVHYIWNIPGANIALVVWLLFLGIRARWLLPARQDDSRFALEISLASITLSVLANTLVRVTGIPWLSYGKFAVVPLGLWLLLYDSRYNSSQSNSYAYALTLSLVYLSIPIFNTAILQAKFDAILAMACMISLGGFLNWGARTIVNWAADKQSGVVLMFPLYLAEDLFQTLLFADSNSGIASYRFWVLVCAQEGSNLLKHLGLLPILRYHATKMGDVNAIHPYDNPEWVVRSQSLAIQDSMSACVSTLVALTAALVDCGIRSTSSGVDDILVFSHETRIDVLASLYSMLLFVRGGVAILEHVVIRQKFARLQTFQYQKKLLNTLDIRPHSAICCIALSCFVFIDSLKWRSYYLSQWPSLTGVARSV